MSVVGEFPGLASLRRRTIRGPVNPMDKSTVVSIYPKEIDEVKHTISPGRFLIPAGSVDKPAVLNVGPSSWWREIDEEQPLLEIPVSSIQVADAIVKDYCNGVLACNMSDSMPGLFYVPGQYDVIGIKKNFMPDLEKAILFQNNFWRALVKLADALWARSSGNPLAISDDMRLAAKQIGVEEKDWMKDFKMVSMVRCFACGALKNPEYPVCASCRAIDGNHPRVHDLKFA